MHLLLTTVALAGSASDCGVCHIEIYEGWRASRHAAAASNAVFRASWEHWPNGWCLSCHAPQDRQQVDLLGHVARDGVLQRIPPVPPGRSWQDGVDCEACHLRADGALRSARPSAAARGVHRIVAEPVDCAGCHEFPFQKHTPALPFSYGSALAQSTVTEWKDSSHAETPCATCHLEGHRFPGAHSPDLVRAAIEVDVRRNGNEVVLTIRNERVGHSFPSGDPFRRVEFALCDETCEPVAWFRRSLRKTETSWEEALDTRIPAGGSRTVRVPASGTRWQLWMRYGDKRFKADLSPADVGYVLAEGPL